MIGCVVHDAVDYGVGVELRSRDAGASPSGVLGAEHRRGAAVSVLEELEQHAAHAFGG